MAHRWGLRTLRGNNKVFLAGAASGAAWELCMKQRDALCVHGALHDSATHGKLTWLVLGGDPAARSHRAEQLTAL